MTPAKKILVVDDDVDLLEQAGVVLQSAGYEIVTAVGQEEAEEKLLSVHPDLCVVDLMMEHQDSGFVLCNNIKRLYPETPVILLTAVRATTGLDFTPANEDAVSWLKADALLDKPVRPEELREEVKRLLAAQE